MKKNLILIGFMGCGKSTLGVKLSYRLRTMLTDTDELIEKKQKKTIPQIFAEDGEEAFRRLETEVLRELLCTGGTRILSTGGGLPMREENRTLLKQLGTVVYLRIRPETVWNRLKGDTTRPLLQKPDPKAEICRLLELRGPLYEAAADRIVDVDGKTYEQLLREIIE